MSDTGQFAAAIIRYAAKSFCAAKSLLCSQVFYCRTHADTRQIAKQPSGGECHAYGQKFFFVSPKSVSPRYVEGDGHRAQIASVG
jgi:hypothetical protein